MGLIGNFDWTSALRLAYAEIWQRSEFSYGAGYLSNCSYSIVLVTLSAPNYLWMRC